jgi:hypothetical protein
MASCWKARHRACGTVVRFTRACQEKKVYDTQKVAVTMAEARHTKACLTVEALPTTEPHERVIDVQRQHWSPLAVMVAQEIGDRHEYDLFES